MEGEKHRVSGCELDAVPPPRLVRVPSLMLKCLKHAMQKPTCRLAEHLAEPESSEMNRGGMEPTDLCRGALGCPPGTSR